MTSKAEQIKNLRFSFFLCWLHIIECEYVCVWGSSVTLETCWAPIVNTLLWRQKYVSVGGSLDLTLILGSSLKLKGRLYNASVQCHDIWVWDLGSHKETLWTGPRRGWLGGYVKFLLSNHWSSEELRGCVGIRRIGGGVVVEMARSR